MQLLFSPLDHSYGVELGIQEPGPQLGNQRTVIINRTSEGAQASQVVNVVQLYMYPKTYNPIQSIHITTMYHQGVCINEYLHVPVTIAYNNLLHYILLHYKQLSHCHSQQFILVLVSLSKTLILY